MNPKCYVFIATSLDGYIARPDGGIEWLESMPKPDPNEDFGYKAHFNSVDALVMGKNTFDKVMSFPEWPYGDKPLTVLSHSLRALPPSLPSSVQLSQESPSALLDRLGDSGIESVYVDGGAVIQSFLRDGLIDELAITTIPVLLGAGIPLFGTLDKDVHLELKSSQVFSCGFVLNRYRVKG